VSTQESGDHPFSVLKLLCIDHYLDALSAAQGAWYKARSVRKSAPGSGGKLVYFRALR
jgi:hypothetical protein